MQILLPLKDHDVAVFPQSNMVAGAATDGSVRRRHQLHALAGCGTLVGKFAGASSEEFKQSQIVLRAYSPRFEHDLFGPLVLAQGHGRTHGAPHRRRSSCETRLPQRSPGARTERPGRLQLSAFSQTGSWRCPSLQATKQVGSHLVAEPRPYPTGIDERAAVKIAERQ